MTAFGVFQTYYEGNILAHESPSTISWIGSIQSFLLLFVGCVSGPLFDAGYTRSLLFLGTFGLTFGLMMTSISTKLWQMMLSQAICIGLATGCLFIPCVAILPQYFKKRRAIANGIAATGSGIGGAVYPIMFRQLQLKIGFAWTTRVLGFVAFGTCLVSILLLRVRFRPQENRSLVQLSAFKDPAFSLFLAAEFIGFCGLYNMLVYIQPYVLEKRIMNENLAFYLVPILNAASIPGRILPNCAADFIGPINVMIPLTFCAGILGLCWIGIANTTGIIILAILYGFNCGAFVSIPPIIMISITTDLRDLGTRLGMSFVMCGLGSLIGTPVGGAIIHITGSYLGVKLLVGSCLICSSVLMIFMRFYRVGSAVIARA